MAGHRSSRGGDNCATRPPSRHHLVRVFCSAVRSRALGGLSLCYCRFGSVLNCVCAQVPRFVYLLSLCDLSNVLFTQFLLSASMLCSPSPVCVCIAMTFQVFPLSAGFEGLKDSGDQITRRRNGTWRYTTEVPRRWFPGLFYC